MEEDTEFLLRRAKEEVTKAISADDERAAEAHQALAVRYSAKALIQLSAEDETPIPGVNTIVSR